ncbi:hypothetical protein MKX03_004673, partial [Papaver bracteatum]
SYMWKMLNKRSKPGQIFQKTDFGTGASSSHQLSANATEYYRNWSLMQSYFHWDSPLPVAKKLKITELNGNNLNYHLVKMQPIEPRPEVIKDIFVCEETENIKVHPHQWFRGETSVESQNVKDPKGKGKQVENYDK